MSLIPNFQSFLRLKAAMPGEDEFKASFKSLTYSARQQRQKKIVQYALGKMDRYFRGDTAVDYNQMTIEHILPQSGNRSDLVGQLGNLVYLPPELNGALSNCLPTEKIQILKDRNYPMDPKLQNITSWSEDEIAARTDFLAETAYNHICSI